VSHPKAFFCNGDHFFEDFGNFLLKGPILEIVFHYLELLSELKLGLDLKISLTLLGCGDESRCCWLHTLLLFHLFFSLTHVKQCFCWSFFCVSHLLLDSWLNLELLFELDLWLKEMDSKNLK